MKIIFFGTPDYVIPIAEKLDKNYELVAVVTQPPKLAGRKQFRSFSPIDNWAHKKKVKVITELNLKDFPEAELGIVASYGVIIPQNVIEYFKYGILNIHPSLLPKYRGASPIQAAIRDEDTTGVTIIKMDKLMHHGPILSKFKESIDQSDTTYTLRKRLFERSAQFIVDLIPNYVSKRVLPKEQDHAKATFTKIIKSEDGFIDIKDFKNLEKHKFIERKIRAMTPWPGAWTTVKGRRLKLLKSHLENEKLILDEVQLEGKKPVIWKQFSTGHPEISESF